MANALNIQIFKHNVSDSGTRAVAMCYARNSAKGHSTPAPVLAHLPFPGVKQQAHLPLDPQVLKTKGNSFHSVHLVPAPNLLRCQVFQVDIQPCQREDRTPPSTYVQQRQESEVLSTQALDTLLETSLSLFT